MRAHERYVAALSHDFGTPISALQMAMKQIVGLISPAEHEQLFPLLDGAQCMSIFVIAFRSLHLYTCCL